MSLALHAPVASADTVEGTRSELLKERSHSIALTMHAGHGRLVVRRTVFNGGTRHDQATFFIDLPPSAVAVGLRTLGHENGAPRWFTGALLEAEAAAHKYQELTGIGGFYPKDPALLSWRSQELLALQVFPCAPGQPKTIEYTLALPTHYRDGAHHLELPALGSDALSASIHAVAAKREERVLVAGAPVAATIRPEPGSTLDFALSATSSQPLFGDFVSHEFAPRRVLTRYAANAAPRVSAVPRHAKIVLLVDASRSTASNFVEQARAALDAYLSHFTTAQVEIITFNRRVTRVFDAFVPLARARSTLAALPVEKRNGSDVDTALFEADRLLASTAPGSARRIVLLTDGLSRAGLTPERLRAATSTSGAVTHLGLLEAGSAELQRDDEHPWSSGLRKNRGLVWRASINENDAATARAVYEEWARPLRLHHFRAVSSNVALQDELEALPNELAEGQGVENLLISSASAPSITFEGELWTERVATTLEADAAQAKLWSALVFGSEVINELSEGEMMTLALHGGAVSPVTSYLAIEPGVRPSTEGLSEEQSGFGSGMGGFSSRMGATHVSGRASFIDRDAFLRNAIAAGWRRCGGQPGSATVEFETTLAEVVRVTVSGVQGDRLLRSCLEEVVWDLALPPQFSEEWNSWFIAV